MKRITVGFIVLVILALPLLWALSPARAQQTTPHSTELRGGAFHLLIESRPR